MSRVEWDRGWYQKIDYCVNEFMDDLGNSVLEDMVQHCPVDSGRLINDLDSERVGKVVRVGARSVPYAIYVEEGTPRHPIYPKMPAYALWWEGAPHPVNKVNHPGAEATHFMKNALYKERTPG